MKPAMTEQEIANELGISQQAVNEFLQKGIAKFKKNWELLYGPFELPHITDKEMFKSTKRKRDLTTLL